MNEYEINHKAHRGKLNNKQLTNYKKYTIYNKHFAKLTEVNVTNISSQRGTNINV